MAGTTGNDDRDERSAEIPDLAEALPSTADPLEATVRRHQRRQRALGVALVATIVAGPALGMAIERGRQPEVAEVTATGDIGAAADRSTSGREASVTDPFTARGMAAADSSSGAADMVYGGGGYWGEPLEPLGTGRVGDLAVRLYAMHYAPYDDGNPFWDPPPGCELTGSLSIQVSTDGMVAVLGADRFGVPGQPDGTVQLVGVPEGEPRWIVVAEVGAGPATVSLPDGRVVDATTIGGITVASAPAPGYAEVDHGENGYRATVTADGQTHEIHSWSYPSEDFHLEHCQPPPPELPEPGDQPSDPAAATEAVRTALATVFGPADVTDKSGLVQHPEVVVPAREQLAESYPDLVATATMGELVFTGPAQAFFIYDLDAGIVHFTDQIGEALFLDGRWVIAAETVCAQLRKGGATCAVPGT